jgi:hypothetical protein
MTAIGTALAAVSFHLKSGSTHFISVFEELVLAVHSTYLKKRSVNLFSTVTHASHINALFIVGQNFVP